MHFYELLSCDRTCEVAHMDCDLWSHNIAVRRLRTVSAVVFSRLGDGRGAFLSGCKSDHPLVVGAIVNFDTCSPYTFILICPATSCLHSNYKGLLRAALRQNFPVRFELPVQACWLVCVWGGAER